MTGTTAIAAVIASLVGVLVSAGATAGAVVLLLFFGGGVAVVMDGGRVLGGHGVGLNGLLLEEFHEERDLVGDGVSCTEWRKGIVEFSDAVGASKFGEHGGDACSVVGMVVGEFTTDGFESRPEFVAPIVAHSDIDVGNVDNCELRVVDLDAIGVQSAGLRVQ